VHAEIVLIADHRGPIHFLKRSMRGSQAGWSSRIRSGERTRPLLTDPLPSLEDRLPLAVVAAVAALFAVQALLTLS